MLWTCEKGHGCVGEPRICPWCRVEELEQIAAWESAWQEGKDDAAVFARERDEARAEVEELERKARASEERASEEYTLRHAAEAKLAKVVKALSEYVSEDAAFAEDHLLCGGDCDWSARHKRARAALAAAKGE